ncbi:MAG: hypothetical protein AAGA90_23895 [Actinomycetota bacterium]
MTTTEETPIATLYRDDEGDLTLPGVGLFYERSGAYYLEVFNLEADVDHIAELTHGWVRDDGFVIVIGSYSDWRDDGFETAAQTAAGRILDDTGPVLIVDDES